MDYDVVRMNASMTEVLDTNFCHEYILFIKRL